MDEQVKNSIFVPDPEIYGKKVNTLEPQDKKNDIDLDHSLYDNIISAGMSSQLNLSSLNSLSNAAQTRNEMYNIYDTMCEDGMMSAIIETHANEATERNDKGNIVWVEASNTKVSQIVDFFLDSINVNKNIYKWVYSLCKYGDVYLRLYRESEYEDKLFSKKKKLDEDVKLKAFKPNDRYALYLEMITNPAEIFELTRFGKSMGYIKTNVNSVIGKKNSLDYMSYQYKFKEQDITVFEPTEFVHACLESGTNRIEESVDIFFNEADYDSDTNALTYGVRSGKSLLSDIFQIWRNLKLLETSVLLNRVTKSSIVRLINVEVGDIPKENVSKMLLGIKQMIEQKAAINVGNSMTEYTNAGPIENNVYIPTHEGVGNITTTQVGGDVDVKSLADLDYFIRQLYGSMGIPQQYFGQTEDSTGFNGGTSLSIISSRFAKKIVKIQNAILQALTDAINLFLLDKGLDEYVNEFTLKMLTPITQEEIDRRESMSSKVQLTSDIMGMLGEVEDPIIKTKMLKSLLTNVLEDSEVIELLQEQIDIMETQQTDESTEDVSMETDEETIEDTDTDSSTPSGSFNDSLSSSILDNSEESETSEVSDNETENILPSPQDLGVDFEDEE